MKLSDIKLPSNKKFGLFFSLIFLLLSIYFFFVNLYYFYSFSILLVFTFIISLIKPKLLKPFNYIWMFIGYSIGRIVNPIVMGMIFFLIFTPISLISKIFNRDELNLKIKKNTMWKKRGTKFIDPKNFYEQF